MDADRLLVTSIGSPKDGYDETTYILDEKSKSTKYSPIAIAESVDSSVDGALIVHTDKTQTEAQNLNAAFQSIGVNATSRPIDEPQSQQTIDNLITDLISEITAIDPDSVIIDITYGFRTLPMSLFTTITYLEAIEDIDIDGIYYGKYEGEGERSPIIDITYLHTLMEWYHAVNSFNRTGELRSLYALMEDRRDSFFKSGRRPTTLTEFLDDLEGTVMAVESGLPLEAGLESAKVLDHYREIDNECLITPGGIINDSIEEYLETIKISDYKEKSAIRLDEDELLRQKEIVEQYHEHKRFRLAIGCARELFLNKIILEVDAINEDEWLDKDTRMGISKTLNVAVKPSTGSESGENYDERIISSIESLSSEIKGLWDAICDARNFYAHSGFKDKGVPKYNITRTYQNNTDKDKIIVQLSNNITTDWIVEE